MTSSWYRQAIPTGSEDFNRDARTRLLSDSIWHSTIPAGLEGVVPRGDRAPYEADGVHTTFPHRFDQEGDTSSPTGFNEWMAERPMVDAATMALAMTAVRELGMGDDDIVDYLSVSLSQVDYVGHRYGPLSVEQFDTLLAPRPAARRVLRLPGQRDRFSRMGAGVQRRPRRTAGALIPAGTGTAGGRVGGRDFRAPPGSCGTRSGTRREPCRARSQERIAEVLEELDFVADAVTQAELAGEPLRRFADPAAAELPFRRRMPGPLHRYGVHLEIRLTPGTVEYTGGGPTTDRRTGTTPRAADLPGGGGRPGPFGPARAHRGRGPHLAALAGIPAPEDLAGRDLFR